MTKAIATNCPYCGEAVELCVDEGGGKRQDYIEDCPVCCCPWEVNVFGEPGADWSVTLRTSDE